MTTAEAFVTQVEDINIDFDNKTVTDYNKNGNYVNICVGTTSRYEVTGTLNCADWLNLHVASSSTCIINALVCQKGAAISVGNASTLIIKNADIVDHCLLSVDTASRAELWGGTIGRKLFVHSHDGVI